MNCELCKKKIKGISYEYHSSIQTLVSFKTCCKCYWLYCYEGFIPDYIPIEQHKKYLIKKIKCQS